MQVRYRAALRPETPIIEGRENTPNPPKPQVNPFNFFLAYSCVIFGLKLALNFYLIYLYKSHLSKDIYSNSPHFSKSVERQGHALDNPQPCGKPTQ
jgi:hypothetical protein